MGKSLQHLRVIQVAQDGLYSLLCWQSILIEQVFLMRLCPLIVPSLEIVCIKQFLQDVQDAIVVVQVEWLR